MLLVNAKAGRSQVHGLGLIAQDFIPKGTEVWRLRPGFDVLIPESQLEHLSQPAREQVIYWAYFDLATRTFVLCSDDDRFTNHSDNPNVECIGDKAITLRDIQAGEELTEEYEKLVVINYPKLNDYGVKWARGYQCSQ